MFSDLKFIDVRESEKASEQVERLFVSSFPEEERPPYEWMVKWENHSFNAVYEKDVFIGLSDWIELGDLVYLFFLAIDEKKRDKGYGSKILAFLKDKFPGKRIFLLAEVLDESYVDYKIRKKRFSFYGRNGFLPTGVFVKEYGVDYEVLSLNGKTVSKAEFVEVMESLIGEEMTKLYYSNV